MKKFFNRITRFLTDDADNESPKTKATGFRKIAGYIGVAVVVVTLAIISFVGYTYATKPEPPTEERITALQQEIFARLGEPLTVQNKLDDAHQEMNRLVGFGAYKQYTDPKDPAWSALERTSDRITDPIKTAITYISHPAVDEDLTTVVKLIDYATENRDATALIEAHRILHDLDTFTFNPGSEKDYWGITKTFEGRERKLKTKLFKEKAQG